MNRSGLTSSQDRSQSHGLAAVLPIFKFLLAGLPGFILAIPLNFLLVDFCDLAKWGAYLIVLFMQVNMGFAICRWKVFTASKTKPVMRQYWEFLGAVAVFRTLDAISYSFMVSKLPFAFMVGNRNCYYLVYQLANVVIFSVAKFVFCRRAIEGKQK